MDDRDTFEFHHPRLGHVTLREPRSHTWVTTMDAEQACRRVCYLVENAEIELLDAADKLRSLPNFPAEWEPGDHLSIVTTGSGRVITTGSLQ